MQTLSISGLFDKDNNYFSTKLKDDYILTDKNGKAKYLLTNIPEQLPTQGLLRWVGIKAYKNGDLSIGQLSEWFSTDIREMMKILNKLNIPVIDYNLDDDFKTIDFLRNEFDS